MGPAQNLRAMPSASPVRTEGAREERPKRPAIWARCFGGCVMTVTRHAIGLVATACNHLRGGRIAVISAMSAATHHRGALGPSAA